MRYGRRVLLNYNLDQLTYFTSGGRTEGVGVGRWVTNPLVWGRFDHEILPDLLDIDLFYLKTVFTYYILFLLHFLLRS